MIFWILCAVLTAVGIAVLLRPLMLGRGASSAETEVNIAVYRDQLHEIERDLDRGLLDASEAEAARREVSRRLLAADQVGPAEDDGLATGIASARSHQGLAAALAVAVIVFSLGGYLALGRPGLPGKPHAERVTADPRRVPVEELIARVEARLQENPDDARGWDVIAPVYLKRGEYLKAARAFQRSIQLNGESVRRLAQFSEAILGATNGQVTDTAKAVFERLLVLSPDYLPAKFWLAMRDEQTGEAKAAEAAYRSLLERPNLPDDMQRLLRERLAAVAGGASSQSAAPQGGSDQSGGPQDTGRGDAPSLEARQEMARLTPPERQQRIRQMVEGLAERLAADGGELAEWQRLIRAYAVLGEKQKAQGALADARKAFAENAAQLAELDAFAGQLGLLAKTD
jgi:cytochrome c-type biogenesis protein CcmH